MMTGRHFSSHRVGFVPPYNYTLSESDFAESYPVLLKGAGYRTGFVGKVGFAVTEEAMQPSAPRGYNMKKYFGDAFDFFAGDGVHYDKGKLWLWPQDDPGLQQIFRKGRSSTERTLKTGEAILRFLDTQTEDQPFCLSVSFFAVKNDKRKDIYEPHFRQFERQVFQSRRTGWKELTRNCRKWSKIMLVASASSPTFVYLQGFISLLCTALLRRDTASTSKWD